MTSYLTNIPNGTDAMQLSCPQMRNNFGQIYNAFAENHVPLGDVNDEKTGMHTQLEMTSQSDPTTASDEVALYSKSGTGSQPQIFFRGASSGNIIQISNGTIVNTGSNYQSFFAGPYIVLFGKITGIANGTTLTYTNLNAGVSFSEIEFIDMQLTGNPPVGSSVGVSNITTTTCKINTNQSTVNVDLYYLIVGKPS